MKISLDAQYEIIDFDLFEAEKWAYRELKNELSKLNASGRIHSSNSINPHAIGIHDVEGWCIAREDRYWLTYMAERGRRSRLSIFTSPFDAANYFLWTLLAHPSNGNCDIGELPIRRANK